MTTFTTKFIDVIGININEDRFYFNLLLLYFIGYGLTESSPVITVAKNTSKNITTVGHVVPNSEIKIIDTENGKIKDPSTPGEICVRGPQVYIYLFTISYYYYKYI